MFDTDDYEIQVLCKFIIRIINRNVPPDVFSPLHNAYICMCRNYLRILYDLVCGSHFLRNIILYHFAIKRFLPAI